TVHQHLLHRGAAAEPRWPEPSRPAARWLRGPSTTRSRGSRESDVVTENCRGPAAPTQVASACVVVSGVIAPASRKSSICFCCRETVAERDRFNLLWVPFRAKAEPPN